MDYSGAYIREEQPDGSFKLVPFDVAAGRRLSGEVVTLRDVQADRRSVATVNAALRAHAEEHRRQLASLSPTTVSGRVDARPA